jgi:hypothetical protein
MWYSKPHSIGFLFSFFVKTYKRLLQNGENCGMINELFYAISAQKCAVGGRPMPA